MNSNLLVKNARIWPSAREPVIENASLLVRDGRIAKIGKIKPQPGTVIDAGGALVLPGFVQTHLHLCHSLFRGLAEQGRDLRQLEAAHDEASIRASVRLACAELIRGGTTAFLSMETVRHTGTVFQAVKDCGLMGVIGHGLLDACEVGGLAVDLDETLPYCDVLLEHWEGDDTLRLALAPHSALLCMEDTLRQAAAWARSRGLILHAHCAERKDEVHAHRERFGMRPVELLNALDITGPDVCLAHCVHTGPAERELLRRSGTRVAFNPSATLKRGSGLTPVQDYLDQGIHVSLGTGSAACNNRLDMFTEMRTAALVAGLPAEEVVHLATLAGAEALRWDAEMGSIEVGKRANLVFVDPESVHAVPGDDPATGVVFSHTAGDVQLTMVNGVILFENGAYTTIDYDKLLAEVKNERAALLARLE